MRGPKLRELATIAAEVWGYDDEDKKRITEVSRKDPKATLVALECDPVVMGEWRRRAK